jgi:hypothetical protein
MNSNEVGAHPEIMEIKRHKGVAQNQPVTDFARLASFYKQHLTTVGFLISHIK